MSTQPRLTAVDPQQTPDFGNVTAHAPELMERFFGLYAELWQQGVISDEVRELARLRNARVTDCGY